MDDLPATLDNVDIYIKWKRGSKLKGITQKTISRFGKAEVNDEIKITSTMIPNGNDTYKGKILDFSLACGKDKIKISKTYINLADFVKTTEFTEHVVKAFLKLHTCLIHCSVKAEIKTSSLKGDDEGGSDEETSEDTSSVKGIYGNTPKKEKKEKKESLLSRTFSKSNLKKTEPLTPFPGVNLKGEKSSTGLELEIKRLKEIIENNEHDNKKKEEKLKEANNENETLRKRISLFETSLSENNKKDKNVELLNTIKDLDTKYSNEKQINEQLRQTIEEKEKALVEKEKRVSDKDKKINEKNEIISEKEKLIVTLSNDISIKEENIQSLQKQVEEHSLHQSDKKPSNSVKSELQDKIKQLEKDLQKENQFRLRNEKENNEARNRMERYEKIVKEFGLDEEEIEDHQNLENFSYEEQIKMVDKKIQRVADKKMKFKGIVTSHNEQIEKLMEHKIQLIGKLYNDN
eukprot:TRINITY_DN5251_c0_g1_i1.p1 TRINITY_DN5251_c0_g1~~TRINITY_DN5251_c0_g1_i1.p1  ORF type:complete len:474 (+),score=184.32 TRINITY_DN5251_c0_g1_i1:40-1422(+)